MNIRQKRLSHELQNIAAETIMLYSQNMMHSYGIISVVGVEITEDMDYVDIFISSQDEDEKLLHFLAPSADLIKKRIARELSLRRMPIIRFKSGKKLKQGTDILSLINSLDHQYGLSHQKNS